MVGTLSDVVLVDRSGMTGREDVKKDPDSESDPRLRGPWYDALATRVADSLGDFSARTRENGKVGSHKLSLVTWMAGDDRCTRKDW